MFNLTRQERQAIIFLISTGLIGTGVSFTLKKCSPVKAIASLYQDFGKVDLNAADKDLLIKVPGVGGRLAGRIIEFREKNSGFNDLEELKQIKGITEYRYKKLKEFFLFERILNK